MNVELVKEAQRAVANVCVHLGFGMQAAPKVMRLMRSWPRVEGAALFRIRGEA